MIHSIEYDSNDLKHFGIVFLTTTDILTVTIQWLTLLHWILIDHAAQHVDRVTQRFIMIHLIDFAIIIYPLTANHKYFAFFSACRSVLLMVNEMQNVRQLLG